jgi:hypothetical protein
MVCIECSNQFSQLTLEKRKSRNIWILVFLGIIYFL